MRPGQVGNLNNCHLLAQLGEPHSSGMGYGYTGDSDVGQAHASLTHSVSFRIALGLIISVLYKWGTEGKR